METQTEPCRAILSRAEPSRTTQWKSAIREASLSEVKMGRGSPICERVRKKIVEYMEIICGIFGNHLQCITSSKVSEKLEKSLCVRDKAKDLCWMPGLRALRRHCITHRHDSVIYITKWAQEYFQKPLSVNTICRAICRCQLKLCHAKRKPYVNMVQKRSGILWAKAHLKCTVSK